MQWPHSILPVKNQVVEFIARWHHVFYKYVYKYRFNRCVHKNTVQSGCLYTKNHAN